MLLRTLRCMHLFKLLLLFHMYIGVELLGHMVVVFEFSVKHPWFSTVTASVYIRTNRIQGFSWNQFTWLKSGCCQDCIPSVGWREVFISCFFQFLEASFLPWLPVSHHSYLCFYHHTCLLLISTLLITSGHFGHSR